MISMTRRTSDSVSGVVESPSSTLTGPTAGQRSCELLLELGQYRLRDRGADPVRTAEAGEVPNVLRRDEGGLRRAGDKKGFDARHPAVHLGLLELRLSI